MFFPQLYKIRKTYLRIVKRFFSCANFYFLFLTYFQNSFKFFWFHLTNKTSLWSLKIQFYISKWHITAKSIKNYENKHVSLYIGTSKNASMNLNLKIECTTLIYKLLNLWEQLNTCPLVLNALHTIIIYLYRIAVIRFYSAIFFSFS